MASGNEVKGRDKNDIGITKTMSELERLAAGAFIGATLLYFLTPTINSTLNLIYPSIFYLWVGAVLGVLAIKLFDI